MPLWLRSVLRGVLVLAAPKVLADSVIVGTVVDTLTRKPLAEVEITAISPGLQGAQVASTDAQGQYRISPLAPGLYTLRFTRSSFQAITRREIQLRRDRTLRVNVELLPESLEEASPLTAPPAPLGFGCGDGYSVDPGCIRRLVVDRPRLQHEEARGFVSMTGWAPRLEPLLPLSTGVSLERSLAQGACSSEDNPLAAPDWLLSSLLVTGFTASPQTVYRAASPGCPH